MYIFTTNDKEPVALRPEMTPSLTRLLIKAEVGRTRSLPLKWYSIPQCWRFESTTRGRNREHYQWNMDIIGVTDVTAEAELLAAIVSLFESLGLTSNDIKIKVNHRQVLQSILFSMGRASLKKNL
jgi:histidyl-tRNA synthetase